MPKTQVSIVNNDLSLLLCNSRNLTTRSSRSGGGRSKSSNQGPITDEVEEDADILSYDRCGSSDSFTNLEFRIYIFFNEYLL